jgi:Glycosyltransferase
MKILVLATTFPRWEKDTEPAFVYYLSQNLAEDNYDISVLVPHAFGAKKYEEIDNMKVHRHQYFWPAKYQKLCYNGGALPNLKKSWMAKLQLPFFLISQLVSMVKIIRENKFDIIHCHWIIPQGFFAVILGRLFNIPVILTAHAGDVFIARNRILKYVSKFILSNAKVCTANSAATEKVVKELYMQGATKIIPMGVDIDLFSKQKRNIEIRSQLNAGDNDILILSVGRFAEKKGLIYLVQALEYIVQKHRNVKLAFIGFGPDEQKLKNLVEELELNDYVEFLGKIPNQELPQYYSSADIFVLPSIVDSRGDTEGLGVVLLEALAARCAVVASNVGGITDIIKDNYTGLLVEQKNSIDLANKINLLIEDEELRQRVSRDGSAFIAKTFSWKEVSDQFSDLFIKYAVKKT